MVDLRLNLFKLMLRLHKILKFHFNHMWKHNESILNCFEQILIVEVKVNNAKYFDLIQFVVKDYFTNGICFYHNRMKNLQNTWIMIQLMIFDLFRNYYCINNCFNWNMHNQFIDMFRMKHFMNLWDFYYFNWYH